MKAVINSSGLGASGVGIADAAMNAGSACRAGMGWQPSVATLVDGTRSAKRDPDAGQYGRALDALARRPGEPIGVSLRLPFCAVRCLCCERDVHAAQPEQVLDDYVAGLVDEIHVLADRLGGPRDVLQLQLGGGSVNVLNESHLAQLVHALKQRWLLPADGEMSVECDPRRTGWGQLRLLRGLGFRQVTFGVLDLDPVVQRASGRLQSAALVHDVCNMARSCGIDCIDLDLMVGLPHQTESRWLSTLQQVVAMAPERVTLARYRHRPAFAPAQCAIDADALPDDELCRALIAASAEVLCGVGYRWIGADHFVLETDPLALANDQARLRRNLIGYTATPVQALLGLGAGAVGEIDGSLFWNEAMMPAWRDAVRTGHLPVAHARPSDPREAQRRAAVEHLLCRLELPSAMLQGGLEDLYGQLAAQAADGVVQVLEDRIVVTEAGRHGLLTLCAGLQLPLASAA